MKKLRYFAAAALLLSLCLPAFAGGRTEDIPEVASAGPERIVSLAPNITEIIFALGKGGALAGRTDYCSYPPEVSDIVSVGPIQQPNVEKILSLEPGLVIASTHAPKQAADLLAAAGIDVRMYYAPASFDGVYEVISATGNAVGAPSEAEKLNAEIKSRYETAVSSVSADPRMRPDVYYVVGFGEGGDWTAGGDTFIGSMLETAGGNNIASGVSGWSFSLEKLVDSDPDIIIIGEGRLDEFRNAPLYSELSAVKNDRVFTIDEDLISRQGPRLIDGLERLCSIFRKWNE